MSVGDCYFNLKMLTKPVSQFLEQNIHVRLVFNNAVAKVKQIMYNTFKDMSTLTGYSQSYRMFSALQIIPRKHLRLFLS